MLYPTRRGYRAQQERSPQAAWAALAQAVPLALCLGLVATSRCWLGLGLRRDRLAVMRSVCFLVRQT